MDIYLIRHTTPLIEKGVCYGQSDLNLAENYSEEFETIAATIPKKENYGVFSSPLKRCSLLAKRFSNDDIIFDNRLKELDFGDWEMIPWNDIPEKTMTPWMKDFVNVQIPNGESYLQLASRVNTFFKETLDKENHETILIITHAGPIRAFLSTLLNIDLKDSFNIKINYGDVFHLKKENETLNLITDINF